MNQIEEMFVEGAKEYFAKINENYYKLDDLEYIIKSIIHKYPKYKGLIVNEDMIDEKFKTSSVYTHYVLKHRVDFPIDYSDPDEVVHIYNNYIDNLNGVFPDTELCEDIGGQIDKIISNSPLIDSDTSAVLTLSCYGIRAYPAMDTSTYQPVLMLASSFKLGLYITP